MKLIRKNIPRDITEGFSKQATDLKHRIEVKENISGKFYTL